MATLYFNDKPDIGGAGDGDWNTIDNWWTTEACETQAASLPTSGDSVVVVVCTTNPMVNTGSQPTVVNFMGGTTKIGFDMTATGLVQTEAVNSGATLTGDAILDFISGSATVVGDVTILQYIQPGYVIGTASFVSAVPGDGLVDGSVGNAYFYNSTKHGTNCVITDNAYFFDNSYAADTSSVGGDAYFYDNSYNESGISGTTYAEHGNGINGSSILGVL